MTENVLEVSRLRIEFGGVVAVDNVSFSAVRGQVYAVIGPNGAGKTTLFNLISGALQPSSGTIRYKGADITGRRPYEIASMGMARTFQSVQTFTNMTVLENVMVACDTKCRYGFLHASLRLPLAKREEERSRTLALERLDWVGLRHRADDEAGSLAFGQQRVLEVARALALDPDLLLLDEPGAGLTRSELTELDRLIQRLRDKGITVLLVEHNMELVMGIADRVMVMDYGQKIAEGTPLEVQQDERVITAYLGAEAFTVIPSE